MALVGILTTSNDQNNHHEFKGLSFYNVTRQQCGRTSTTSFLKLPWPFVRNVAFAFTFVFVFVSFCVNQPLLDVLPTPAILVKYLTSDAKCHRIHFLFLTFTWFLICHQVFIFFKLSVNKHDPMKTYHPSAVHDKRRMNIIFSEKNLS